jgi:hypothetical protein
MLVTVEETFALVRGAISAREPFALMRCGDGEENVLVVHAGDWPPPGGH